MILSYICIDGIILLESFVGVCVASIKISHLFWGGEYWYHWFIHWFIHWVLCLC